MPTKQIKYAKRIAILGFARDAKPLLGVIRQSPAFRGAGIGILDQNEKLKVPRGVQARLGDGYLSGLDQFDVIFRTPGIPYLLPELQKALRRGAVVTSATKLFFEEIAKFPLAQRPIVVGITGTKGKSTTATLLYKMLVAGKRRAYLAGNIGVSPLALIPKLRGAARSVMERPGRPVVVLEMSSFQLQDLTVSPDIAVVLEMFPDHQDLHRSLKEYYGAKANIVRYQKRGDRTFYFPHNRVTKTTAMIGRGKKIAVSAKGFGLFAPGDLILPGRHNFLNAVMAARVAQALGVSETAIAKTAKHFAGLNHRLQFVRTVGGVSFYNDSASHNPGAAAAAVRAFPGARIVLIAGGKDRHIDFAPLAAAIKKERTVPAVILYGENRRTIRRALRGSGATVAITGNLRAAVEAAYRAAKKRGAIVLFSPGSASFDMFRDYVERGEQFVRIVRLL